MTKLHTFTMTEEEFRLMTGMLMILRAEMIATNHPQLADTMIRLLRVFQSDRVTPLEA